MHAQPGDRIVIRNRTMGGPVRDAEALGVEHEDGSPPSRVRCSDNGHGGLSFPGPDASERPLPWRALGAQALTLRIIGVFPMPHHVECVALLVR